MKTIALFSLVMLSVSAIGQTDIIELRSRNVSLKKYTQKRIDDADHATSNFGRAPEVTVQNAVLDSVKCLPSNKVVMYTTEYCTRMPRTRELFLDGTATPKRVLSNPRIGNRWKAGADTVHNHPLFSHRNSLDSIKMVLDRDYHFNHPADSVKFIGFDNNDLNINQQQNQQNQQEIEVSPTSQGQKRNSAPFGWMLLLTIIGPLAIVATIGKFVAPNSSN